MLQVLRDKMRTPTEVGELIFIPTARLTEGYVIDFALTVADLTLREEMILLNRRRFLGALNDALNRHIDSMAKMTQEEREAFVETLVAAGLSFRT